MRGTARKEVGRLMVTGIADWAGGCCVFGDVPPTAKARLQREVAGAL
ncbi:MAG: hypothetical protein ACUVX9_09830 [Anaerolineae bacterium]